MNEFDFTLNFDSLPAGSRFDLAAIQATFNSPAIMSSMTGDTDVNPLFTIVAGGKSGNCLQTKYPKGDLGDYVRVPGYGPQAIIAFTVTDCDVLNMEYDLQLAPGFDLHYLGGKLAPSIGFGKNATFSPTTTSGLKTMFRANNPPIPPTGTTLPPGDGAHFFSAYFFRDYGTPFTTAYDKVNFTLGQWYHWKMTVARGRSGFAKVWKDGVLFYQLNDSTMYTESGPPWLPYFNLAHWFGGNGPDQAALWDSFALYDNIRVWSGTGN